MITLVELRQIARKYGIKGYTRMTKQELRDNLSRLQLLPEDPDERDYRVAIADYYEREFYVFDTIEEAAKFLKVPVETIRFFDEKIYLKRYGILFFVDEVEEV